MIAYYYFKNLAVYSVIKQNKTSFTPSLLKVVKYQKEIKF